ncbi:MAG: hypothetical protein HZA81_02320 [Candidatus Taylorbacteria bacterium]|nr:hypothetical protein [Candidatus Taylorbacteria bacterium]
MVWYSSKPGRHDDFAACIEKSGAKFYGAFWCPHCQEQKALFGRSARKLPYVECSTPNGQAQLPACTEKKVESYPTWHFADGTVRQGTISLAELSSLTNCPIAKQ